MNIDTMNIDTNIMNIQILSNANILSMVHIGSLILSDSLNHASIVNGSRASSAIVRVFRHNDPQNLEHKLREAIAYGQPRTSRPWKKILVMIEGIYSMEGEIVNLPEILRIVKKYRAYVYVDEAHSIGALGQSGRGVCEYFGIDTSEIDILMGTFTKSFGGMGGYIAGSTELIEFMREASAGYIYATTLSPVIVSQVLTALRVIMGQHPISPGLGQLKIRTLRENSNYFRAGLEQIGLQVLGSRDSPVIPVMLFSPSKIAAFSRECYERNLAVVTGTLFDEFVCVYDPSHFV